MTRRRKMSAGFTRNLNKKYEHLKHQQGISPGFGKYTRELDWTSKPLGAAYWAYRRMTRKPKLKAEMERLRSLDEEKMKLDTAKANETAALATAAAEKAHLETARVEAAAAAARLAAEAKLAREAVEAKAREQVKAPISSGLTDIHEPTKGLTEPNEFTSFESTKGSSPLMKHVEQKGYSNIGPGETFSAESFKSVIGDDRSKINLGQEITFKIKGNTMDVIGIVVNGDNDTCIYVCMKPSMAAEIRKIGAAQFKMVADHTDYEVGQFKFADIDIVKMKDRSNTSLCVYHTYHDPPKRLTPSIFKDRDTLLKNSYDGSKDLKGVYIDEGPNFKRMYVQHKVDSKFGNVYEYTYEQEVGRNWKLQTKSYFYDHFVKTESVTEIDPESIVLPIEIKHGSYKIPSNETPLRSTEPDGKYETFITPQGYVFFGNRLDNGLRIKKFYEQHPYITMGLAAVLVTGTALLALHHFKNAPDPQIDVGKLKEKINFENKEEEEDANAFEIDKQAQDEAALEAAPLSERAQLKQRQDAENLERRRMEAEKRRTKAADDVQAIAAAAALQKEKDAAAQKEAAAAKLKAEEENAKAERAALEAARLELEAKTEEQRRAATEATAKAEIARQAAAAAKLDAEKKAVEAEQFKKVAQQATADADIQNKQAKYKTILEGFKEAAPEYVEKIKAEKKGFFQVSDHGESEADRRLRDRERPLDPKDRTYENLPPEKQAEERQLFWLKDYMHRMSRDKYNQLSAEEIVDLVKKNRDKSFLSGGTKKRKTRKSRRKF